MTVGVIGHFFGLSMHFTSRPRHSSGPYTQGQGTGRLIGLCHRPHLGLFAQDLDCGHAYCRISFNPSDTGRHGKSKGPLFLTVTDFGGVDIGIHQAMRRSYGDATNNRDNGVVEAFGGAPPALDFPAPSPAARARVPTTTPTHGSATGKLRGNRAGVGHASGGRACCWCGDRRGDGTRSTIGRAYRTGPGRAPGRSP